MRQSILGQALLGNSYSTEPRQYVQFVIAQTGDASRVQVRNWMELQMAFGQIRRTDFTGPKFHNNAINLLLNAGGRLPSGTTFPNHAVMGVEVDQVPYQGKQALRVKALDGGSAAAQAGVQLGDLIFQIAGKRFNDSDGSLDATAKAAKSPTYEVLINRDGKILKFSFARIFRPAVTAPQATSAITQTEANKSAPEVAISIADELYKLANLKDRGILTQEEYEAKKDRLLNQN